MNTFMKSVLEEQVAKLKEDKESLDDRIKTMQNEIKRLLPIQAAMDKDIKETEAFLKSNGGASKKRAVK